MCSRATRRGRAFARACARRYPRRASPPRPLDVVAVSVGDDLTAPLCSNCPHAVDAHESTGYCDDCKVCEPDEVASDSASVWESLRFVMLAVSTFAFAVLVFSSLVGLVGGSWSHGSEAGAQLAMVQCEATSPVGSAPQAGDWVVSWSLAEVASNYDVYEKWTPTYALAKWLASPHGPVPKCRTR